MANDRHVVIRFKDLDAHEGTREEFERRCNHLFDEFHEATSIELTLSPEHDEIAAHAHASGKNTRQASHASAADARTAGERALDKLERELRTNHDKRIFAPRREAQRDRARRSG